MKNIDILAIVVAFCLSCSLYGQNVVKSDIPAIGADVQNYYSLNLENPSDISMMGSIVNISDLEYVGGICYYVTSSGILGQIDTQTGTHSVIANDIPYNCIAYNPVNGSFYGIEGSSPIRPKLYSIDITTGGSSLLLQINIIAIVYGFDISNDGRFFIYDSESSGINEINLQNGAATTIVSHYQTFWGSVGAVSVDRKTNDLYWIANYFDGENMHLDLYKVLPDEGEKILVAADLTIGHLAITNGIINTGDVNGDGQINITDITVTINFILGYNPASFNIETADINNDSNIDIRDIFLIIQLAMR